ncbi:LppM family (lipo)protein [Isoptericola sp. G70]|uniref:LppM family (lipo)protein n=1 Tax=Isoptericola sp. G70 TaxID=3376633 RepID=UPI003A7F8E29
MQTPTRGRGRLRTAVVALLAAVGLFALAGCMKVDMDMTLSDDDTVSGSLTMAFSDELASTMGMDPQELWDQAGGEIASDLPEGATQEPYADGEYTGTTMTFSDMPIDELSGAGTEELSITREGDEYVIQGTMDMTDDTGQLESLPGGVAESFDVRLAVTFPGEITDTNGTVDGSTVEWRPAMGESTEIFARGEAGGGFGSGFPWWIVGVVVGLAVIALVAVLVVRNNRRPGTAPAGTAPAGTVPPGGAQAPNPYMPGGTPPQPGSPLSQPPVATPAQPPVASPQPPAEPPHPASEPPQAPRGAPEEPGEPGERPDPPR